jgi:hypothetical protein
MLDIGVSPLFRILHSVDGIYTADDLYVFVQVWHQDSRSGLISFSSSSKDYLLILWEGKAHCTYEIESGSVLKYSGDSFDVTKLAMPVEKVQSSDLTPTGVLIIKMIIEAGVLQPENILPKNLLPLISMLEKGSLPVLLELSREPYYAWVAIPGGGLQIKDIMFFDGNQLIEGEGVLERVNSCFEPGCVANYFYFTETDSWLEYVLRYIFILVTEQILVRAAELTSRVMVNSIIRDVNLRCTSENIGIMLTDSKVQKTTIFKSPMDAVKIYRFILDLIIRHIESVAGSGLTFIVVRQIVAGLSDFDIDILKRYPIIQEVFLGFDINPKRMR